MIVRAYGGESCGLWRITWKWFQCRICRRIRRMVKPAVTIKSCGFPSRTVRSARSAVCSSLIVGPRRLNRFRTRRASRGTARITSRARGPSERTIVNLCNLCVNECETGEIAKYLARARRNRRYPRRVATKGRERDFRETRERPTGY